MACRAEVTLYPVHVTVTADELGVRVSRVLLAVAGARGAPAVVAKTVVDGRFGRDDAIVRGTGVEDTPDASCMESKTSGGAVEATTLKVPLTVVSLGFVVNSRWVAAAWFSAHWRVLSVEVVLKPWKSPLPASERFESPSADGVATVALKLPG